MITWIQENLNATATHPATCQEYIDRGETKNGTYTIKPTLSKHSFKVICEFADSKGYTIIKPTNLNETGNVYPPNKNQRCEDANCFTQSIDYNLDIDQLKVGDILQYLLILHLRLWHIFQLNVNKESVITAITIRWLVIPHGRISMM